MVMELNVLSQFSICSMCCHDLRIRWPVTHAHNLLSLERVADERMDVPMKEWGCRPWLCLVGHQTGTYDTVVPEPVLRTRALST